ncbi:methyltransferase-like 26 isoform X2 [Phymastichus coffea]|nr:methyltransferase-like 26 isoform X2 [Phymastichus coffea]XP_058794133.1 methyltransferase-like 26 isoform X2 [Phymastichus coffea]
MAAKKLIYPAADRNKEPILSVLHQYIRRGSEQRLLEISSGSGQHVAHFAPYFPQVTFYPSECEPHLLESIAAHAHGLSNVAEPVHIDITTDYRTWPGDIFRENSFDYIYSANLMHIAPFRCSEGLFRNAGQILKSDGILFTYGPYAVSGKLWPESNVRFDQNLKSQNPEWGVRDIEDLKKLAAMNGIQLFETIEMPANNKTLIWQKTSKIPTHSNVF